MYAGHAFKSVKCTAHDVNYHQFFIMALIIEVHVMDLLQYTQPYIPNLKEIGPVVNKIPYARKFPQYVNFADFTVSY